ncbi:hypothetical protein CB0940_06910 [Cercospora beticola]|uniref:F-box domain-containing protein n=1 Tax=Cercospora beticola TaxID=122368 RepID=A0A2G5H815_CERBT|nr:hypothetical protein CB0940_06910 [Cercospora beticola]PIA88674.1 hypothetical protein CB0940_06910 [Cercospora beticola]WPB02828.1 hypothetical protein RHO25_007464 [Cercospora beticola]CAK1358479.1 unnamed protein product [Cercospora beticola]
MFSSIRPRLAQIGDSCEPTLPNPTAQARVLPSATIHDLPIELLVEIVGYTPDIKDLRSLCLASKSLSNAATPSLYHNIYVGKDAGRMHNLVRTLSQSPPLAMHIKSMQLHLWTDGDTVIPTPSELISFLEAILPIASYDSWFHRKLANALRHGYYDGNAILLLLLAVQVDKLDLLEDCGRVALLQSHGNFNFQHFPDFVKALIKWAASSGSIKPACSSDLFPPKSALNNVRTLRFYPDKTVRLAGDVESDDPFDKYFPAVYPFQYMLLPRLEEFSTRASESCNSFPPMYGQANSYITRLHITWTAMDSKDVGLAIRTCQKLVELSVQWNPDTLEFDYSTATIDLHEIRSALGQHADSLKILDLSFTAREVCPALVRGNLGTLSQFSALQTLHLDETSMFRSEVSELIQDWEPLRSFQRVSSFLPSNLQEFHLDTRKPMSPITVYEVLSTIGVMLPARLTELSMVFEYGCWIDLARKHTDCCQVLSFHPLITGLVCGSSPTRLDMKRVLQLTVKHQDGVLVGLREAMATDLKKALREGLKADHEDANDEEPEEATE